MNCPAQYREYAQDIHHSGSHLLDIINDILDMSKIEAGKLELREGTVELSELARDCLHLIQQRALAGNVEAVIEAAPESINVYADPIRLKQVLLNLLTNAIKFTPAGGRVTVGFGVQDDGEVALSVGDSGIGMSAAEVETALQPFRQVDSALSRKYEGTGLGLPLVKVLVELHGGRLAIENTPGAGTRVTVLLPAERLESETEVEPPAVAVG